MLKLGDLNNFLTLSSCCIDVWLTAFAQPKLEKYSSAVMGLIKKLRLLNILLPEINFFNDKGTLASPHLVVNSAERKKAIMNAFSTLASLCVIANLRLDKL